jgi:hypothetical protein
LVGNIFLISIIISIWSAGLTFDIGSITNVPCVAKHTCKVSYRIRENYVFVLTRHHSWSLDSQGINLDPN